LETITSIRDEDDIWWLFLMRMYHDAAYGDYIAQSYLLYSAYLLVQELGGDGQSFQRRVHAAHEAGWPKPRKGWPFPFEIEMR
jgi:hypothetical protein